MSEAKLIHARPAVIQELEWPIWLSSGSSPRTDPVRTILFSFYNGELFRILVSYDRDETKGLSTEDMIEAFSAKYGTATKPANIEIAFSSTQVYNDSEAVIARWEDPQYSFNLFRSSFQPTFGMVAFSKGLDALARTATAEAIRLDALEAPQREIQRQNQEDGRTANRWKKPGKKTEASSVFSVQQGPQGSAPRNYFPEPTTLAPNFQIVPPTTSDELAHALGCAVESVLDLRRTQATVATAT